MPNDATASDPNEEKAWDEIMQWVAFLASLKSPKSAASRLREIADELETFQPIEN